MTATTVSLTPHRSAALVQKHPSAWREFWSLFASNPGALAGLVLISVITLMAIFADVLAKHDPIYQYRDNVLTPPSWDAEGSNEFLLGTDDVGRDVFSRLLHGARLSLFIGIVVVTLSLGVGVALGLLAGYYPRTLGILIMRVMDIIMALPGLLLTIAIIAILGPGIENAMFACAVAIIPNYVRLTRASVIQELTKDYTLASKMNGAKSWYMMFSVILPNCMAPLIVQATLGFSSAILDVAALGFLGLGAQPPTPEWGTMLSSALKLMQSAWWVVTFPGLAILITVLAFNLLGDGLRDALDPRMKR